MNAILTLEQLLSTFERYNLAIWPVQVAAYVLGTVAIFLTLKRSRYSSRIIFGIFASLWLWTGVVFFLRYFAQAFTPAYVFGVLFVVQGIVFLANIVKPRVSFGFEGNLYSVVGIVFIAYALIGYPVFGYFLGHRYPESPAFGLTPCPLTVFTFGLLLLTDKKVPWPLLIIPLLWAIGGVMPVSVGILEDIGLVITGVVGTAMLLCRDRRTASP